MKTKTLIIVLFVIAFFLLLFLPKNRTYIKQGKLYISEIMANNSSTIQTEYGEYSDYIEIYNGNRFSLDLSGFHLSDSEFKTGKWTFPKGTKIEGKSYLLIFADERDVCDKYCHTNFKLSSLGEAITLTDRAGNIISKVTYSEMDPDASYAYSKGKYKVFMNGTPGKENNAELYKATDAKDYKIKITEYMTRNKVSQNNEGFYNDWVEIYNDSDEKIDLKNIYITDNPNTLKKYRLEEKTLNPHEYYVIELDDKAGFGISEKETIIISNGKDEIDKVEVVSLSNKVSYGLKDNEWYYFPNPTKGRVNDTAAFKEWVITNESP